MIKQIGTKIYYCNITGNIIKIIGDMQGYVKETTFEEDFSIYEELKERNKDSVGLIQLEYGQYVILSKDSTGVIVDLETKELIFTYEPIPMPPIEPTWEEQVDKKISILQEENEKLNTQLNTVRASHSDLILDLDFRVMDIEDNLGIAPMKINLFNILGGEDNMNSTFMVVLDKIETGSYKTKDEIESICDRYLARGRITGEEYDMLMKALDKKEKENNQTPEEVK